MSAGADSARKRTLWGSSALEMGDHRLLEDGSERRGALVSDVVAFETARGGGWGWRESIGVSMGVDRGNERCVRGARLRVVICESFSTAAIALPPSTPMLLMARLRMRSRAEIVRDQACHGELTNRRILRAGSSRKQPT
jgi:hypothetical protein